MDNSILPQTSEELFYFVTKRTPYLCGFWRFANAYVFTYVKGDYGETIYSFFQYAVLIDVPRDIRIQRVKNRSFQKFGERMLLGGDLHEQEEKFFDFVKSRPENTVEEWVKSLKCPILRIDGTKPIEENVDFIMEQIQDPSCE